MRSCSRFDGRTGIIYVHGLFIHVWISLICSMTRVHFKRLDDDNTQIVMPMRGFKNSIVVDYTEFCRLSFIETYDYSTYIIIQILKIYSEKIKTKTKLIFSLECIL